MPDFTENNAIFPAVSEIAAPSYAPTPPVLSDGESNHPSTFNTRLQALVNRDANLRQAINNLTTSIASVNQQITAINTALNGLTIGEEVQGFSAQLQTLSGLANVTNLSHLANLTLAANRLLSVNTAGNNLAAIDKLQWIILSDVKASGVHGGTATQGAWNRRTLNTIFQSPTANVAALDTVNNTFTLPAGTYIVVIRAPAGSIDWHQVRLRNNTDNISWLGSSQQTLTLAQIGSNSYNTDSWLLTLVTITGSRQFQIETFIPTINPAQTAATTDLGGATGSASGEVYTQAIFIRLN